MNWLERFQLPLRTRCITGVEVDALQVALQKSSLEGGSGKY